MRACVRSFSRSSCESFLLFRFACSEPTVLPSRALLFALPHPLTVLAPFRNRAGLCIHDSSLSLFLYAFSQTPSCELSPRTDPVPGTAVDLLLRDPETARDTRRGLSSTLRLSLKFWTRVTTRAYVHTRRIYTTHRIAARFRRRALYTRALSWRRARRRAKLRRRERKRKRAVLQNDLSLSHDISLGSPRDDDSADGRAPRSRRLCIGAWAREMTTQERRRGEREMRDITHGSLAQVKRTHNTPGYVVRTRLRTLVSSKKHVPRNSPAHDAQSTTTIAVGAAPSPQQPPPYQPRGPVRQAKHRQLFGSSVGSVPSWGYEDPEGKKATRPATLLQPSPQASLIFSVSFAYSFAREREHRVLLRKEEPANVKSDLYDLELRGLRKNLTLKHMHNETKLNKCQFVDILFCFYVKSYMEQTPIGEESLRLINVLRRSTLIFNFYRVCLISM